MKQYTIEEVYPGNSKINTYVDGKYSYTTIVNDYAVEGYCYALEDLGYIRVYDVEKMKEAMNEAAAQYKRAVEAYELSQKHPLNGKNVKKDDSDEILMKRKRVERNGRKYIELDPDCVYGMPLKNGYLDIRVSHNPDYPGLDVTYISDNPHPGALPNPRVRIETPYDVDTGGYNLLRALIWTYRKSKQYTYEIELTKEL